ncbi:MAG: DUF99 family protein [archaeon]|nr:DUF99 family protein [archaeon]
MPLHLEKKAIRALGIAESFSPNDRLSTLAGVVMRSDLVIDGFGIGSLEVSGSDATDAILSLFEKMKRNDINVLLLSGSVLSLYNIVDVDSLYQQIKIPTLALTFKKSQSDLERNIKTKFDPREARVKIKLLQKLGMPQRFKLKTGFPIFVRSAGVTNIQSQKILDKFTLQGSIPEPIRIARLLSKSIALFEKRSG